MLLSPTTPFSSAAIFTEGAFDEPLARPRTASRANAAPAQTLFSQVNRRPELVAAYPELGPVCVQLGFGPELTLREWCAAPEWALLLLARSARPPAPAPDRDWSAAEVSELIEALLEHHHAPLRNELRRLGILIGQIALRHPGAVLEPLDLAFRRLEANLVLHLDHEERVVFPQCLAIEAASRGHAIRNGGDIEVTTGIRAMLTGHDEESAEVAQVIALVDAAVRVIIDPDLEIIRSGMVAMAADLAEHAAKEANILVPAAIFAEELLRSRERTR